MPLTGEEKKKYQREYMRKKRLGLTGLTENEANFLTLNQPVIGSSPMRPSFAPNKFSTKNAEIFQKLKEGADQRLLLIITTPNIIR